jgi:hypothetical protein
MMRPGDKIIGAKSKLAWSETFSKCYDLQFVIGRRAH